MTPAELYDWLRGKYGPQPWWPCRTGDAWEIAAGAILTQNTAWENVEKALGQMASARLVSPGAVLAAEDGALQKAIRPAGFFRQKSAYLKAVAAFYLRHAEEYARPCGDGELAARRTALLAVKGVGRETADDMLIYAFRQPVFVVDAYTRRVAAERLGADPRIRYEALQRIFMDALPKSVPLYAEFHALIVCHCKTERGIPLRGNWNGAGASRPNR